MKNLYRSTYRDDGNVQVWNCQTHQWECCPANKLSDAALQGMMPIEREACLALAYAMTEARREDLGVDLGKDALTIRKLARRARGITSHI